MAGVNRRWAALGAATVVTIVGGIGAASFAQGFDPWVNSPLMKSASNYWTPNNQATLGQLGNDEAIVVDLKGFNIAKGGAKGDTAAHVDKLHAREVAEGAIIFRSGNKLYIVDGKEVANK